MKLIDRTGLRYGRLLVLNKSPTPRMWLCLCDCGAEHLVTGGNLANGSIRSCGCLKQEFAASLGGNPDFIAKRSASAAKHGQKRRSRTGPEYKTWLGMKRRCNDPKSNAYEQYGARGIRVCARWDEDFTAFLADMGPKPTPEHSIDRLNSFGNYEPGNCRWATPLEQSSENKRDLIPVTVDGVQFLTLAAACRHFGVKPSAANERIRAGIAPEIAVSTPERMKARRSRESYIRKDLRQL